MQKPKSTFFMLNRKYIIVGFLILILAGYFGIKKYNSNQSSSTYQTSTVSKGTIVVSVSGSGKVTSSNNSPVLTNATGVVQTVYVKEGEKVRSGQKIASIELDQSGKQKYLAALASYQSAKNNLELAKANSYSANSTMWIAHEKLMGDAVARSLAAEDPTMIQQTSEWNAAETRYKTSLEAITQAQNFLASASLALAQSSGTIYAPLSGTIAGLTISKGSFIASSAGTTSSDSSTSNKIASVITNASPTIAISLTEIDIPKVKVGNKATITLTSSGDKTYVGHVSAIDTSGSVSSGVTTYPAYIELENEVDNILPNMSASASIITNTKDNVLIAPSSAIETNNGTSYAKILSDGKEKEVPVVLGIESDSQIEIVSGLSEGQSIITGTISSSTSEKKSNESAFSLGARSGSGAVRVINR